MPKIPEPLEIESENLEDAIASEDPNEDPVPVDDVDADVDVQPEQPAQPPLPSSPGKFDSIRQEALVNHAKDSVARPMEL